MANHPQAGGSTILVAAPMELLGLSDLSRLLDRDKSVIKKYVARDDFPKPLGVTASGRVWRRSDIDRWITRTGWPFAPGRPKKDAQR